ncbi:serine/threonine protein kinase, putative [Plasmodium vivax]|uniref:Serine/threonine-protein kinase, putative n=6 Tax=Plasmodium vivax TaxID=5855 RepID=A5JZE0_PLAVS|nr:serine/threonine-protein kinase, putative [Plasmodium vivax]KMZ77899.1 serine/threonine-protein kinase [Plasmodium vivax India VII]KMZ84239.1 serine/threonine-protein kinase [Plasmodium vivax Brazil I]KMZ90509.1 serine/threonine-protein kinase [Plasmodium vivax Mauritania I]KMZ97127.1 serine/threonine-protein kinase [Plasmodium vivax North Korean]EDL47351.1 serine/threonine-protein kinase, putative [Plasmodium vivax]|eukprot:XP_001617078.1 serine/threonine-protein kinase [Plasmodium vivax Sal-1]
MHLGRAKNAEEDSLSKGEYKQVYLCLGRSEGNDAVKIDISYDNNIHDVLQLGREKYSTQGEYITDSCGNVIHSIRDIIDGDTLYLKDGREKLLPIQGKLKNNFIVNDYIVQKRIGSGGFGIVFQGIHIQTKQKVALKFIPKSNFLDVTDVHRVFIEIQTLRGLIHNNIIKMYDVNHFENHVCLIMEYAINGDLKNYILKNNGYLSEKEAHDLFVQIIRGVYYCHSKHIVHRDLKLENILLDKNMTCKIADFGLSDFVNVDQNIKTEAGTKAYIAPEIIFNQTINYSVFKLDIWSLGILLYIMTQGFPPFKYVEDDIKYFDSSTLNYPNDISDDLKNLISLMLNVDPNKRPIIVEILNHRWFGSFAQAG